VPVPAGTLGGSRGWTATAGTGLTRWRSRPRAGSAVSPWMAARSRWRGVAGGWAHWRTGARIRAVRSAKGRSRTAGCGARGTGMTMTRCPAGRRQASPTGRRLRGGRPGGRRLRAPPCPGIAVPHGGRRAGRDAVRVRDHARVRHGRPLQPGLRRRHAARRGTRGTDLHRDPARGRGLLRGQRIRQAGRPARRLLRDRGTGVDQHAHRPVRRQARPVTGRGDLRTGAVGGAGTRGLPGPRPDRRVPGRGRLDDRRARRQRPRRTGRPGRQARPGRPRRRPPGAARRGTDPAQRRGRQDPAGPIGRAAHPAQRARAGPRRRPDPGQPTAGADRRTRRPARHRAAARSCRATQRAGADHFQGQGPDPGH
jgi:hypothetical protein